MNFIKTKYAVRASPLLEVHKLINNKMEYSAVHNKILVTQEDLKRFSIEIRYAMADIRKELKVPLTSRKREAGLERIDHIERNILSACKSIGIDLGAEWGDKLDLSEFAS